MTAEGDKQVGIWVGCGQPVRSTLVHIHSFTQEVILVLFGVPFNPGHPVVRHTVDQLGASGLPEHGQILRDRAQ